MASPSLNAAPVGGPLPPSTAPPTSTVAPVNGHGSVSRSPSKSGAASLTGEGRVSLPPIQPSLLQETPKEHGRIPTPPNGPHAQRPGAEIKPIVGTDEYLDLSNLIKKSKPETVRQVVRDCWQRCIIGSDFHVGFILNTALHHASSHLLDQAVQDFGARLASSTKHKWVQHLETKDVDEIADALFQRASDRFLDRALARRLETISGRALVNALARAERLGYDTRDIVEEKDMNKVEHVIPSMHPSLPSQYPSSALPSHPPRQYPSQYSQQPQQHLQPQHRSTPPSPSFLVHHPTPAQVAGAEPLGIVFCDSCGRPCSGAVAVENHLRKRACNNHVTKVERLENDTCLHCGVWFTSNGGLLYHMKSNVCGNYSNAVRLKMIDLLTERAKIPSAKGTLPGHSVPSSQPPPLSRSYSTPTQARSSPTRTDPADAYAALTPQQQANFDAEMKHAEDLYGGQMRQAMTLPAAQAEVELAKIKNRLNSRQSNLRKKYGIKLRDRRTRAQIDADNARIASNSPLPSSTAGTKRLLPADADSPRKRVPLSEMSGLTGAAASAEMTDPTLNMTPTQPGGPIQPASSWQPVQENAAAASQAASNIQRGGNRDDPMTIDSDRSTTGPLSGRPSPSVMTGTPANGSRPTSAGGPQ